MLRHPNSISFRVRAACAATQCSSQTELTFIVRDQSSTEITAGFCCRFHSVASEAATITSFVVRTPTALIRCRTPDFLSSTFISFSISIASMRAVCCFYFLFRSNAHTHTHASQDVLSIFDNLFFLSRVWSTSVRCSRPFWQYSLSAFGNANAKTVKLMTLAPQHDVNAIMRCTHSCTYKLMQSWARAAAEKSESVVIEMYAHSLHSHRLHNWIVFFVFRFLLSLRAVHWMRM